MMLSQIKGSNTGKKHICFYILFKIESKAWLLFRKVMHEKYLDHCNILNCHEESKVVFYNYLLFFCCMSMFNWHPLLTETL